MTSKALYISDLDGTLLRSDKELSDYTKKSLNTLISNGVHFSVATARSSATALKILEGLNIDVPVVLMNGVVIYDIAQKKYVKLEVIPTETVRDIIDIFKKHDITGFMYAISNNEQITYYENLCTKPLKDFYDERVTKYDKAFEKVESFIDKTTDNIIYFSFMDLFDRLYPIQNELKNHPEIEAVLYRDVYNENIWFLEIHSKNASKYNAVKYLREYFGYDRIIGFGDNLNDIPLLKACDEGYAVSNAVDELKEKANGVIDDNNSDGVAKYIFEREAGRGF
ncbi:Cof-type HAD-IIB family hydrolase [Acetivibrio cellulolyticus]|uniref:Cof-type HAD-IIB family hydrolase n=1 Tax=Acetivibrio cellulolyticus TaxID=35830 RepID=UPI0001E2D172|nr:Cof-type HAD-IIB family hydrolase [Acetivibrio cellulolyticus]